MDRALPAHGFECEGFGNWLKANAIAREDLDLDHLAEYHQDLRLCGQLNDLVEHLATEVFHVLFSNRALLGMFNELLSRTFLLNFSDELPCEYEDLFERQGKLKRVSAPEWAKRAVFHRDRGLCAFCQKDLSGLVSTQPGRHFDHIVPLAQGGLNDVTNLQLLCESCNLKKSSETYTVSGIYEAWY